MFRDGGGEQVHDARGAVLAVPREHRLHGAGAGADLRSQRQIREAAGAQARGRRMSHGPRPDDEQRGGR